MTDHKTYSLKQVENFLYDAMSSDATPQEIYDVIKGVVQDNYYTYKKCASEAYELLGLLNGNGEGHVTCSKDDTSEECKKSWSDFWEDSEAYDTAIREREYYEGLKYTDGELDAMCAAAEAKDKVIKWSLPVEEHEDGEYYITFPDDLLEATNLKEGNQIEWIDQGNGSYLLKKVPDTSWVKGNELAKVKTHQEMIDDGWEMTADGFWIKEN
jgi:bifunctional DNA-binding transcriptional regulator/antitoxin component of YhaV-PrlF toxin-antitoxin module